MKTIAASKFKEQCLSLLDTVDEEGIVITKHGTPVARLVPYRERTGGHLIGILKGRVIINPDDDLLSTGAWVSDEWGDLNNG